MKLSIERPFFFHLVSILRNSKSLLCVSEENGKNFQCFIVKFVKKYKYVYS